MAAFCVIFPPLEEMVMLSLLPGFPLPVKEMLPFWLISPEAEILIESLPLPWLTLILPFEVIVTVPLAAEIVTV
jgi:hypothetical protein